MDGSRISRRDFLSLLGYGIVALGLGSIFRFSNLKMPDKSPQNLVFGQSSGSWTQGPNTSVVAIHSALLPNGKIFYLAGSGYHRDHPNGPFEARIFDPSTNNETQLSTPVDLFCIGLTHLSNGNVLLAGGTLMYDTNPDNCNGKWHGLDASYVLNFNSGSLSQGSSMAHGRWYPTLVSLTTGQVFVGGGLDEYGVPNDLIEVYDPASGTWSISLDPGSSAVYCVGAGETACVGSGSPCYGGPNNGVGPGLGLYPRMHLMPSGLLALVGPSIIFRTWDPNTGAWSSPNTQNRDVRSYGTSFLLPLNNIPSERGKVLVCGGSIGSTGQSLTSVDILDFDAGTATNPAVRHIDSISNGRKYLAPVILPTGKLLIFGGTAQADNTVPVFIPEIFNPSTETWQSLPAASVPRVYHQTSILLPDGRVWTAGGTPTSDVEELRTEIFSPDYITGSPRPTITGSPQVGDYGFHITISTPDAASISSVSLVRLMATTHHYDANQRLIWLQIVGRTSNSVTVSAPINSRVAPPGFYMIFIINGSGIPSVSKIIQIPGSGGGGGDTTPPSQVTGLAVVTGSDSQLNLSWNANAESDLNHYNVYRGTSAGFTVTPGTTVPAGQPTTNSFFDVGLNPSTTYYYKVAAVDNAGNIGSLSLERSGTTAVSVSIFYDVPIPGNATAGLYSGNSVRYGEEANTASSLLVGKSLKSWKVRLRKRATPSGNVTAKIRRRSDDAIVATFNESINSQTLDTAFAEVTFTLTTPYTLQVGDRIMVEYAGPQAVEMDVWTLDKFDGANTRRVRFTTVYSFSDTADVAGSMSSAGGGIIPPAQVTGLAVTTGSDSQLNLSWNANTEFDLNHYNVYRGTSAGFTVTPGTTVPAGQPTTNSFFDVGLNPSTTYYYKVAAVDNAGNIGPLSLERSGTTSNPPDVTPPSQVTGLAVATGSDTQLNLSWIANTESDLNHYNVYRGTSPGFTVIIDPGNPEIDTIPVGQPIANSFFDVGLNPSTTYYYKVAAVDNAGNIGSLSTEMSGITASANPIFYDVPIPGNGTAGLYAGSSVRYGEEANTASSLLVGKSLKSWKVRLRKRATPSGNVTAKIRRRSDDAIVATFNESINSQTLGTSFADYTFTLTTPYTIQVGDRIMVEYAGPQAVEMDVWTLDKFDGANTRRVRFTDVYSFSNAAEVSGNMSSS